MWPLSARTSQRLQTPRTGLHWGCVGQGRPAEQQFKVDRCLHWPASVSASWMLSRLLCSTGNYLNITCSVCNSQNTTATGPNGCESWMDFFSDNATAATSRCVKSCSAGDFSICLLQNNQIPCLGSVGLGSKVRFFELGRGGEVRIAGSVWSRCITT